LFAYRVQYPLFVKTHRILCCRIYPLADSAHISQPASEDVKGGVGL
jgi:hypothetical protein